MTTPTIALIVAAIVAIIGLRIVIRKALDDYSRPFFSFDEAQAQRDIEEALSHADSDMYTRKQLGTIFNTKENHVPE